MPRTKEQKHFENISKSINEFTVDFHKSIAKKTDGNFVCSPLSAHTVLSMAAYGAGGTTKNQMRKTLHLPENDQLAQQEFQTLIDSFNSAAYVTLKAANKIYTSDRIKIEEHFKEITSTYFQSKIETFDCLKNEEAAKEINKWCRDQTNGKITDLINPDMLTESTRMLLLNAVYFQCDWCTKFFESNTEIKPFHVNKTTKIKVPTMYIEADFYYKQLKDLKAIIVGLPYKNPYFYMLIIVPKAVDGLKEVEKKLKKIKIDFNDIVQDEYGTRIKLSLPKFKVETTLDLKPHLEELGMVEMFSDTANFDSISNDSSLKVNKVMQKSFIEVNEEGTEAAAVTGLQLIEASLCLFKVEPPHVVVDRPFLYMVMYKDFILFSGRIVNPLEP